MTTERECPSCGIPLCKHERVIEGEFVRRDGTTSTTYTERCLLFLGHRGPHRWVAR